MNDDEMPLLPVELSEVKNTVSLTLFLECNYVGRYSLLWFAAHLLSGTCKNEKAKLII
jgi:hypothetical protein